MKKKVETRKTQTRVRKAADADGANALREGVHRADVAPHSQPHRRRSAA